MKLKRILISAILAANIVATSAQAHTSLTTSSISAGAVLESAPAAMDLAFGADVGLTAVSLSTAGGEELAMTYEKPKKMQRTFSVPLPSLGAGDYPMSGEIPFSVK